jgi:molecular chaperone GrpE
VSHKRHIWETISDFLTQQGSLLSDALAALERQVGKLGREQYKANALAEAQSERLGAALETLQATVKRQEDAQEEAVRKARLSILEALLPVLDGLEAGLRSGGRHAYRLRQQGSPEAATLTAWLDGQRLLRQRLVSILKTEGIQPILTVGQPFDPYRHVAVGTLTDESRPDGQIAAEEQRGYTAGDQVLRYAEVVVVRNQQRMARDR